MAYIGRGNEGITRNSFNYIAGADQTSFSCMYSIGYVDVYWNGFKLDTSEYSASTGNSVDLVTPATAGDKIDILCWDAFSIVNIQNVQQDSNSGAAIIPLGSTEQRPLAPVNGMIRFNSTLGRYEGYNNGVWGTVGGAATGGGNDQVFVLNDQVVTTSYTIPAGKNAHSVGPITIMPDATVTIPDNSIWEIG